MENITIKSVSVADYKTIQAIAKQTFHETFADSNSEENMQKYLSESFSDEKIIGELENIDSIFFIAEVDNQVLGYLKLNTGNAQTELQDSEALEIERIYVLRAHHGKKVGQLLYEKAVETAVSKAKNTIWLGVWEENKRARRFYEKNGFVPFDKHLFKMGDEEQTDIMMRKNLLLDNQ